MKAKAAYLVTNRKHPYIIIEYEDGSRKSFTLRLDMENAARLLRDINNRIGLGTFELADFTRVNKKCVTLEKAAVEYIGERSQSVALGQISAKTREKDEGSLLLFGSVVGKKKIIGEIKKEGIREFVNELTNRRKTIYGTTYRPASVLSYLKALQGFFSWSQRRGYAGENPIAEYRRIWAKKEKEEAPKYFNELDLIKLREELAKKAEWRLDAFNFAAWTAARASEVLSLKAGDIVEVERKGVTRLAVRLQGKGGKRRIVPLADEAEKLIRKRLAWLSDEKRMREMARRYDNLGRGEIHEKRWKEKYIFWEVANRKSLSDAVREARLECGIEQKITFHSARHTYATNMLRQGVEIKTLSVVLGHAEVRTTEIYAKVVEEGIWEQLENVKQL